MATAKDPFPLWALFEKLRELEARDGADAPKKWADCPPPMEVVDAASGEAPPEVNERVRRHAAQCDYCRVSLEAIEQDNELEDPPDLDDRPDPTGEWVMRVFEEDDPPPITDDGPPSECE